MYRQLLRPLLFSFDPELIHHFTFRALRLTTKWPFVSRFIRGRYTVRDARLERTVFGIHFRNPVGLAAGFDKDAALVDELSEFGFGCIEIGTLTPLPQPGNEKPRLFRLPADRALINRMGFNNDGVAAAAQRLQRLRARGNGVIIGGNIGKNKTTPNAQASMDYLRCVEMLHPFIDYFVVNVSSPNTPGLRELQEREPLRRLLGDVIRLSRAKRPARPVLLKISPDLSNEQLEDIVGILRETNTDGVIATNTTLSREGLATPRSRLTAIGAGGLSGRPIASRSNDVIRFLRQRLGPGFPIIGVGGILSVDDALEKLSAGADLIQIYTGFIYEGPGFVRRINEAILEKAKLRSEAAGSLADGDN